jgi:hypothetical protein
LIQSSVEHQSNMRQIPMFSFSYSVTRQYPYKWFTPVAVIGGIILAVLFSLINLFSNAYNMVTITTDDPDITEAGRWSGRVPSILTSKIQPKCDDVVIPIGSTVRTNQTILSYQVIDVLGQGSPALTYHNQPIEGCRVPETMIELQTNNGQSAVLMSQSDWGVAVDAKVYCIAPGTADVIVLGVRYNPISDYYQTGFSGFLSDADRDEASGAEEELGWAELLVLGFWAETVTAITNQTTQQSGAHDSTTSQSNLSSGIITFQSQNTDIKSTSFFKYVSYSFFNGDAMIPNGLSSGQVGHSIKTQINCAAWPNIWAPADRLAKAMFSIIIADLGQLPNVYLWDGIPQI